MTHFLHHGHLTTPGRHASAIAALPDDIESLLGVIRGLIVHCDHLGLYGLDESAASSRETLSLETRLDQILDVCNAPLETARNVELRAVGTCRDYALMTCGILRQKQIPSRVRCGFAGYFAKERWEDHWVCEYWRGDQNCWALADAQLDATHCRHLGILFDTSDLPAGEFLNAAEAWRKHRNDRASAESFGHGDATGQWFLWVSLARDYLALCRQEISIWDGWRDAGRRTAILDDSDCRRCDDLATRIEAIEAQREIGAAPNLAKPFWL